LSLNAFSLLYRVAASADLYTSSSSHSRHPFPFRYSSKHALLDPISPIWFYFLCVEMLSLTTTILALIAYLSISNAYSIEKRLDITQAFKSGLTRGTQIYLPSQPNYANETTQRWTEYEEPTYVAAIKPANANDVRAIVISSESLQFGITDNAGENCRGVWNPLFGDRRRSWAVNNVE
jgi:hypothetical protein